MEPGMPLVETHPAYSLLGAHEATHLPYGNTVGPQPGHWDAGAQLQLPPDPSQHTIPTALHVREHDAPQLQGKLGRDEFGVGGVIGRGAALATFAYEAICAMPHCPSGGTFLAICRYPCMPQVAPHEFFTM